MTIANRKPPASTRGSLEIRRGRPSDAEQIVALARVCGLSPWTADHYRACARRSGHELQVAELSGEFVGYCLLRKISSEAELLQLAVESRVRRRGVGSALLQRCLAGVSRQGQGRCFLEVRAGSTGAVEFYRTHGFREVSRRPGYYSNPPEDAIVMAKELDPRVGVDS